MKRSLLLCTTFLMLSPLMAASVYQSNSIGQERGAWEGKGPYRLVQTETQSQLYGLDGLIWTRQQFNLEDVSTVVKRYKDGSHDLIQTFKDGVLVQEQVGGSITYFEHDENGFLVQQTTVVDGSLAKVRLFGYSDHALVSILTISDTENSLRSFGRFRDLQFVSYVNDRDGQLFTTLSNGQTIHEFWIDGSKQQKISVLAFDDGGMTLIKTMQGEQQEEHYNGRGLLVSVKTPSSLIEYRYNDDRMLTEERISESEGRVTIKTYENGNLAKMEELKQGEPLKSTRYVEEGGSVQTLYSSGSPYADVTYANDGKRVLSITYY